MGQWKSERGVVSDHVARILGAAFREIGRLEIESADPIAEPPGLRRYEMLDLADAIEFCSRGILKVEIREEAKELIKKMDVRDLGSRLFETIPNRGQMQDTEEANNGLDTVRLCEEMNKRSDLDVLYALHESPPGNPIPTTVVKLTRRKPGGIWRVDDTLTEEGARAELAAVC